MLKRLFDIILSSISLIIFLPLILLFVLMVKLTSKGPSIYVEKRVGKDLKLFSIYKIRTMYVNSTFKSHLTYPNDSRITKIGKFLRKYKLDELPQFFNILMGDMSFVGPRPENQYFVNFYNEKKKRKIYTVRPGLTDFSSIDFFDETKFLKSYSNFENVYIKKILPIKQNNSIKYVKKQSFILDIIIIIKTLVRFLKIRSN